MRPISPDEGSSMLHDADERLRDHVGLWPRSKAKDFGIVLRLLVSVLFLTLSLLVLDAYVAFRPGPASSCGAVRTSQHSASSATIASPAGFFAEVTSVFQAQEQFLAPYSDFNDVWNTILPPGRGFVFVEDSSQYGLQAGQETEWGEIYSVSLFHQLHCLALLRKKYWTLMDRILDHDHEAALALATEQQHHDSHVGHCFDYLRQGIMCAGDMSMEWPRDEPVGKKRVHVDGWGIPHVCKDWDQIWDYMLVNGYNASQYTDTAL